MITLYHNSRCSKSRAALEILEKSGVEFTIVEYLKTPPTPNLLNSILKSIKKEPHEIVRTGEDEYEELKLKSQPPKSRDAWIEVLCKNPILIERPIVTDGKTGVVGRPPENVTTWLKTRQ